MDISKETCWKLLDHHYASVTWEIQEEKQEKRKHAERVLVAQEQFRSYGNENWEFEADGLMQRRFACINDMPIKERSGKAFF